MVKFIRENIYEGENKSKKPPKNPNKQMWKRKETKERKGRSVERKKRKRKEQERTEGKGRDRRDRKGKTQHPEASLWKRRPSSSHTERVKFPTNEWTASIWQLPSPKQQWRPDDTEVSSKCWRNITIHGEFCAQWPHDSKMKAKHRYFQRKEQWNLCPSLNRLQKDDLREEEIQLIGYKKQWWAKKLKNILSKSLSSDSKRKQMITSEGMLKKNKTRILDDSNRDGGRMTLELRHPKVHILFRRT